MAYRFYFSYLNPRRAQGSLLFTVPVYGNAEQSGRALRYRRGFVNLLSRQAQGKWP